MLSQVLLNKKFKWKRMGPREKGKGGLLGREGLERGGEELADKKGKEKHRIRNAFLHLENAAITRVNVAGLKEIYHRFPFVRGSTLEEAEAAVKAPHSGTASFPFRKTRDKDDPIAGPSRGITWKQRASQGHTTSGLDIGTDLHGGEDLAEAGGGRIHRPGTTTSDQDETQGSTAPPRFGRPPKPKKGTVDPHHSESVQKYGCSFAGKPVEILLRKYLSENKSFTDNPMFCSTCLNLVSASLARNTWKRYNSALRLWNRFQEGYKESFDFLDVEEWDKKFLIWGWHERRLSVNTLKIYLSELKNLGNLAKELKSMGRGLGAVLIKGMSNVATPSEGKQTPTNPLTIADLREIRKGLEQHSRKLTGQSVWTCCLVAFWGAFCLGELLGNNSFTFDKFSNLLWEDVELTQNSVKIKIKSAKVRGPPGNSASLFSIPDKDLCPVLALTRLRGSQLNLGMGEKRSPAFRESGGQLLTKKTFLDTVNAVGKGKGTPITGKSFRTALPSALENFPTIFRESHIKALGRWRGPSYQVYMKNDKPNSKGCSIWFLQFY
jgi:hypothetical protein